MDEESVGILGVLLIVTVLVMSQTALHGRETAPRLPDVKWADLVSTLGCGQSGGDSCSLAADQ
jgi:hypothetical protein